MRLILLELMVEGKSKKQEREYCECNEYCAGVQHFLHVHCLFIRREKVLYAVENAIFVVGGGRGWAKCLLEL